MSKSQEDGQKNSDTLKREIDETRAEVGRTVDALARKFSPGELLDESLKVFRQHGGEAAQNLGSAIKQNPLPVMLTAVGLTWLMMSSDKSGAPAGSSDTSLGESMSGARQKLSGASEQIKERAASTREWMAGTRDAVSGTMGRGAASTKAQAAKARDSFNSLLQEQPLILGAVGVALGAVLGSALPRTELENRIAGSASDAAKDQARQAGREIYGQARGTAEKTAEAAREEFSDETRAPV